MNFCIYFFFCWFFLVCVYFLIRTFFLYFCLYMNFICLHWWVKRLDSFTFESHWKFALVCYYQNGYLFQKWKIPRDKIAVAAASRGIERKKCVCWVDFFVALKKNYFYGFLYAIFEMNTWAQIRVSDWMFVPILFLC